MKALIWPVLHIHVIAPEGLKINNIDEVQSSAERDNGYLIEWWAWRINLALLFTAGIVFMCCCSARLLPARVMLATFLLGFVVVLRLPGVRLDEFRPAVRHGEILMMVDASSSRILDISRYIRRRHPEARIGGVGWHIG